MPVSRAYLYISFRIPSKRAPLKFPLTQLPQTEMPISKDLLPLSLRVPSQWIPLSEVPQWGPYGERHLSPVPTSTQPLIIHLSIKVLSNRAPSMSSKRVPMDRDALSPEPMVYSFTYISRNPIKKPSHEMWGKHSHRSCSPTQMKGLQTMGCGLVPQEDH